MRPEAVRKLRNAPSLRVREAGVTTPLGLPAPAHQQHSERFVGLVADARILDHYRLTRRNLKHHLAIPHSNNLN